MRTMTPQEQADTIEKSLGLHFGLKFAERHHLVDTASIIEERIRVSNLEIVSSYRDRRVRG